nr:MULTISPECIES: response regulator transcription factor [unclassified Leucobacter]
MQFGRETNSSAQVSRAATGLLDVTAFASVAVTYAPSGVNRHQVLFSHGYSRDNMLHLSTDYVVSDPHYRQIAAAKVPPTWRDTGFGTSYSARTWLMPSGYRDGVSMAIHDDEFGEVGSVHANSFDDGIDEVQVGAVLALGSYLSTLFHERRRSDQLQLTAREIEVIGLVAQGASNPEIAEQLHLSRSTVGTHIENILRKTGARSRVDIAVDAVRRGLV